MTPETVRDNLKALSAYLIESSGPDFMYQSVEEAIKMLEGWRDISSAPRDGTEILLFGAGYLVDDPRRYATTCHVGWLDGDHWATRDPELICDATHWRPLPAPPALECPSSPSAL